MNKQYKDRKLNNLCVICGKLPPEKDKIKCHECTIKYNNYAKELSLYRKSLGLCKLCGNKIDDFGTTIMCRSCADSSNNKEKIRDQHKKINGVCLTCNEKAEIGRVFCAKHAKINAGRRKLLAENKKCTNCGGSSIISTTAKLPLCETCWFKASAERNLGTRERWYELKEKLYNQNCRCAYSGRALKIGYNANLDHIFPSSRYPEFKYDISNLVWVDKNINELKNNSTYWEFIDNIREVLSIHENMLIKFKEF